MMVKLCTVFQHGQLQCKVWECDLRRSCFFSGNNPLVSRGLTDKDFIGRHVCAHMCPYVRCGDL